jgi:putative transposase
MYCLIAESVTLPQSPAKQLEDQRLPPHKAFPMEEESHLEKSITNASWKQFRQFLTYKAVAAGRKLELVNPAYTTQDCYQYGHRRKKKISERTHCCSECGYQPTRDLNGAQNILVLRLRLGSNP